MLIGYARTSTVDQEAGFEAQLRDLKAGRLREGLHGAGLCRGAERQQLDAALDYLRSGDVLVVTKLDRLARSVADLCKILGTWKPRAWGFES